MKTNKYKKKDIDIRFIIAGIAFFSLLLFYPLIDYLLHDYKYMERNEQYNMTIEKFHTLNSVGFLNNSILMGDYEDNYGNFIFGAMEKGDIIRKEKESDIITLIKSDTSFFFILR